MECMQCPHISTQMQMYCNASLLIMIFIILIQTLQHYIDACLLQSLFIGCSYIINVYGCFFLGLKHPDFILINQFAGQVKKIRITLRNLEASDKKDGQRARNLPDIEVGSVEKFQGDEREVIIISTVRSQNILCEVESIRAKLGFLTNKKVQIIFQ